MPGLVFSLVVSNPDEMTTICPSSFLPGYALLGKRKELRCLALSLLLCVGEILHLPSHILGCNFFASVCSVPSQDENRRKDPCAILLCSHNIAGSS